MEKSTVKMYFPSCCRTNLFAYSIFTMHRSFRFYPLLLLLFSVLWIGCTSDDTQVIEQAEIPFRADGLLKILREDGSTLTTLAIEIAEGDSARARGLMQRTSLPARGGMLFIDSESKVQTFWMRNTPLPLDLIFIDADSQFVSIAKNARPFSDDTISSADTAMYVLEVNGGFSDKYKLDESMSVSWELK